MRRCASCSWLGWSLCIQARSVQPDTDALLDVQEAAWKKRTDEKLSELQLDGLVESTKKAAKFVVLGSTENHYTVTLNDARHTCQCVDFRCDLLACHAERNFWQTHVSIWPMSAHSHDQVNSALQCSGCMHPACIFNGMGGKQWTSLACAGYESACASTSGWC